jgi:phosphate transport system substrate-binding protein
MKAFVIAAALISLGGIPSWGAILIHGAGATFPYPLYSKWFYEYQKIEPEVHLNYQPIGSGGGIRQLLEGTIDFGATDAPMTDEQLKKAEPLLHIPTCLGAVVITYSLPNVPNGIRMNESVLSDLFLGKIKRWNDPRLSELNPKILFPDLPVLLIRRSDGSGTTAVLTQYLSQVSPEWKQKVGTGTAVNWPVGVGAKGNAGIAGLMKQTPGSLGYVELIYAEKNQLNSVSLQNPSGNYVFPNQASTSAAALSTLKLLPQDLRASIIRAPGKTAYPMSAYSFLLIKKTMPREKGAQLKKFLNWAIQDGQSFATRLSYSPLPEVLVGRIQNQIKLISLQ